MPEEKFDFDSVGAVSVHPLKADLSILAEAELKVVSTDKEPHDASTSAEERTHSATLQIIPAQH